MARPRIHIVQDGILRDNLTNIADRSKKGLPNFIIVFGPTRSGKTTFVAQGCHFCSNLLNTPYDNQSIYFNAGLLFDEAIKGKKKRHYHLDEAAFDLMGEDHHNDTQKNLIKLVMTSAKHAQTIWVIIPRLERLRETFFLDEHTKGVETYFDRNWERGYFKLYDQSSLLLKYGLLKAKKYYEANQVKPFHRGRFNSDMSFIDLKAYEAAKDEAIRNIGANETSGLWKGRLGTTLNYVHKVWNVPIKDLAANIIMMPNKVSELSMTYPSSIATSILETRAAEAKKISKESKAGTGKK